MKISLNSKKYIISFFVVFIFLHTTNSALAQRITPNVANPTNPPGAPGAVTGINSVVQGSSFSYTVTAASGATSYTWSLSPTNAGTITGTTTSASVKWSSTFTGAAYVICTL